MSAVLFATATISTLSAVGIPIYLFTGFGATLEDMDMSFLDVSALNRLDERAVDEISVRENLAMCALDTHISNVMAYSDVSTFAQAETDFFAQQCRILLEEWRKFIIEGPVDTMDKVCEIVAIRQRKDKVGCAAALQYLATDRTWQNKESVEQWLHDAKKKDCTHGFINETYGKLYYHQNRRELK